MENRQHATIDTRYAWTGPWQATVGMQRQRGIAFGTKGSLAQLRRFRRVSVGRHDDFMSDPSRSSKPNREVIEGKTWQVRPTLLTTTELSREQMRRVGGHLSAHKGSGARWDG